MACPGIGSVNCARVCCSLWTRAGCDDKLYQPPGYGSYKGFRSGRYTGIRGYAFLRDGEIIVVDSLA
jgi:hypothetical protein